MTTSPSSPSLDNVIAFVADFVTREYDRTRQRVNGTRVADAVKAQFPGLSYPALGVEKSWRGRLARWH